MHSLAVLFTLPDWISTFNSSLVYKESEAHQSRLTSIKLAGTHKREQEIKECQYVSDGPLGPPFLFIRLKSDNWGMDFKGSFCEIQRSCLGSRRLFPISILTKELCRKYALVLFSESRAGFQRGARSAENIFLLCQAQ